MKPEKHSAIWYILYALRSNPIDCGDPPIVITADEEHVIIEDPDTLEKYELVKVPSENQSRS